MIQEVLESSRAVGGEGDRELLHVLGNIRTALRAMASMAIGAALSATGSTNVGEGALSGLGIYAVLHVVALFLR